MDNEQQFKQNQFILIEKEMKTGLGLSQVSPR